MRFLDELCSTKHAVALPLTAFFGIGGNLPEYALDRDQLTFTLNISSLSKITLSDSRHVFHYY
jgi:hypothetical protein